MSAELGSRLGRHAAEAQAGREKQQLQESGLELIVLTAVRSEDRHCQRCRPHRRR